MGKYSLLMAPASCSSSSFASAAFTVGNTHGLPSSERYAPTPKFNLSGDSQALNAWVTPRMGSGGAMATSSNRLWSVVVAHNFMSLRDCDFSDVQPAMATATEEGTSMGFKEYLSAGWVGVCLMARDTTYATAPMITGMASKGDHWNREAAAGFPAISGVCGALSAAVPLCRTPCGRGKTGVLEMPWALRCNGILWDTFEAALTEGVVTNASIADVPGPWYAATATNTQPTRAPTSAGELHMRCASVVCCTDW